MSEDKDVNLIAIKSLIECIDNRDIAEGGIFLDDDNAEFVADILRYHYESLTTENRMEAVAKLFGKKLGEEFTVEDKYKAEWHCKFTKNGVMYQDRITFNWHIIGGMLQSLVTGKSVIVDE